MLTTGAPAIQMKRYVHKVYAKVHFLNSEEAPSPFCHPTPSSNGTEDMKVLRNIWGKRSPGNRPIKNMEFNNQIIENSLSKILLPCLSILTEDHSLGTRLSWVPRDK